jgi:hypothetical protein
MTEYLLYIGYYLIVLNIQKAFNYSLVEVSSAFTLLPYASPAWNLRQMPSIEITAPEKQGSEHHWQFSKITPIRDMHMAFKIYNQIIQPTSTSHSKL